MTVLINIKDDKNKTVLYIEEIFVRDGEELSSEESDCDFESDDE